MSWEKICKVNSILPNAGICALINEKQIAVFRLDGNIYALDNFDPFSKANVISRGIVGDLKGKPVVASPIYKQHFCLVDGVCLEDENVKLNVYETRVVGDDVELQVA